MPGYTVRGSFSASKRIASHSVESRCAVARMRSSDASSVSGVLPFPRQVQRRVRRLVGEGGEFDVRGPAGAKGDAAAVGVAEQAACEHRRGFEQSARESRVGENAAVMVASSLARDLVCAIRVRRLGRARAPVATACAPRAASQTSIHGLLVETGSESLDQYPLIGI